MGANVSKLREVTKLVSRACDHVNQVQNDFNTVKDTFTGLKDGVTGLADGDLGITDAVKIVDTFSGALEKKEQMIAIATQAVDKCQNTIVLLQEAQEALAAAQCGCMSNAIAAISPDDPELKKLDSEIPDLKPQRKKLDKLDAKIQDSPTDDLLLKIDIGKTIAEFYLANAEVVLPLLETSIKTADKVSSKAIQIKKSDDTELLKKGPQIAMCIELITKIKSAFTDLISMLKKTKDVFEHFKDSMPKDLGDAALGLAKGVLDKVEDFGMGLLGGA